MSPDQRLVASDLQSPEFLSGAADGLWGQVEDPRVSWPQQILWIAVPPRPGAPDRVWLLLNLAGYRAVPPTGSFVDPVSLLPLELGQRPTGRDGSRLAMVCRTDWEGGKAFYHPYDRVASSSHADWPAQMPGKLWSANHTLVDYLDEFHAMFQSEDYLGV